jgi:hypothetical protein
MALFVELRRSFDALDCIHQICSAVLLCIALFLQLRRSFDALDHDHDSFITSADLLNLQPTAVCY